MSDPLDNCCERCGRPLLEPGVYRGVYVCLDCADTIDSEEVESYDKVKDP